MTYDVNRFGIVGVSRLPWLTTLGARKETCTNSTCDVSKNTWSNRRTTLTLCKRTSSWVDPKIHFFQYRLHWEHHVIDYLRRFWLNTTESVFLTFCFEYSNSQFVCQSCEICIDFTLKKYPVVGLAEDVTRRIMVGVPNNILIFHYQSDKQRKEWVSDFLTSCGATLEQRHRNECFCCWRADVASSHTPSTDIGQATRGRLKATQDV